MPVRLRHAKSRALPFALLPYTLGMTQTARERDTILRLIAEGYLGLQP